MISQEHNDRITRVGPGTPLGGLLSLYWQPVALVDELVGERPVRPVRLMGRDYVLFRDQACRLGLIDRACPHRGADLAFGRLEDGGLRCLFHGWLFDATGACLEMPAEPADSTMCQRVRVGSYPVVERHGVIFGYVGPGAPPAFPAFDCFRAPESHGFAFKGLMECNWLQALEVGIDPAHASFLHRFFEDEDPGTGYGRQFRSTSADSDMPMTRILREHTRPRIDIEMTEYGMRLVALRPLDERRTHVRVTNLVFPQAFVIPMSTSMTIAQWHVPIDDTRCYWYAIFTSFAGAVDKEAMRRQRLELYETPDYRPRRNRANDYGYDPAEQRTRTYTGMGFDINAHDQWACESQGPIQDRTREHLGESDKAIIAYRRLLARAIDQAERGERPMMVLDDARARAMTGPIAIDGIGEGDPRAYWQGVDASRRAGGWARDHAPA